MRAAARALARGPDAAALSALAGALHEPVLRGIRKAILRYAMDTFGDFESEAYVRFLDDKLPNPAFVAALAEANNPPAYAHQAALRFTVDLARKRPRVAVGSGAQEDASAPMVVVDQPDDGVVNEPLSGWYDLLRELITELPARDRILLCLVYCLELDDQDLTLLAEQRGVAAETVRRDIATRILDAQDIDAAASRRLDQRVSALASAQRQLRGAWAVVAEVDEEPLPEPAELTEEQRRQFRSSQRALAAASAAERAAYVLYLEERAADAARLVAEARRGLARPMGPGYEQIAEVMGLLAPGAPPQERKRTINKLTVQRRRLEGRLTAAIEEADDD